MPRVKNVPEIKKSYIRIVNVSQSNTTAFIIIRRHKKARIKLEKNHGKSSF